MSFEWPWALLLLLFVPVTVWLGGRSRARAGMIYSSEIVVEHIPPTLRQRLMLLPEAFLALALICLVVALARPRQGIGEVRTTAKGVAIMMVADRSGSMGLPFSFGGQEVTRLEAVKQVFTEFVIGNERDLKGRPEDLIGLVTFARFADTVCPPVQIHDTLVKLIETVELADPRIEGGTAVGDGLALGATRLKTVEDELKKRNEGQADPAFTIKSKVIVLLTDGDENVGEIASRQAADMCKEWGIKVYAIGVGDERGGIVNTPAGQVRVAAGGFDEAALKSIAAATGGAYYRAGDGAGLRRVYGEIDALEKTEIISKEFTSYREVYAPWAISGLALISVSMLLSSTVLRRTT